MVAVMLISAMRPRNTIVFKDLVKEANDFIRKHLGDVINPKKWAGRNDYVKRHIKKDKTYWTDNIIFLQSKWVVDFHVFVDYGMILSNDDYYVLE